MRPGRGDVYYCCNYCNYDYTVIAKVDHGYELSKEDYEAGNYYIDINEAEEKATRLKAIDKINDRIIELNEGDNKCPSFTIAYYKGFQVRSITERDLFFPCRTEEIAKQIIEEFPEELKLIFRIK